jgi:hypothetical protein
MLYVVPCRSNKVQHTTYNVQSNKVQHTTYNVQQSLFIRAQFYIFQLFYFFNQPFFNQPYFLINLFFTFLINKRFYRPVKYND